MGKSTNEYKLRAIKALIKRMEEPNRPSVTLGKADIVVVLPILKKELGD